MSSIFPASENIILELCESNGYICVKYERVRDVSYFGNLNLRRYIMDAITANQAQQDINRLIEQVISDAEPTIICNDQGKRAVLLSLDEFNSWEETLYLLSNPANAEHLRKSIRQDQAGKITERDLLES